MSIHAFDYGDGEARRALSEARILRFLADPFELAAGRAEPEAAVCRALLDHLVGLGLPFRPGPDGRRFDLAEVVNFIKWAHFERGDPTWRRRSVATMRRLSDPLGEGREPDAPPDLAARPPALWAVTLTRRIQLPGGNAAPLRLQMPRPLNADPATLQIAWLETAGAQEEPRLEPARLTLKAPPGRARELVLKVRYVFADAREGASGPAGLEAAERALYLAPREGLVQVGGEIRARAARLGLDAGNPEATMRRIWDHLASDFSFGFIHYDRLAPEDPLAWGLATGRLDCRTGTATLIALCRAAGVPARMVTGYTLHPALPTSHTWAEVFMPERGWVPFDTYALDLAGGEAESPWREHFFGRIDDRFVAERLPRAFAGAPRLDGPWRLALGITEEGATTWFERSPGGEPIYAEAVKVERRAP